RGAYSMISNFTGAVKLSPASSSSKMVHLSANPTAGITEFSYDLDANSYVSLSVVDALGRQVAVLTSNELQYGIHQISWNTENILSGEYYYQFMMKPTGGKELLETGKIIVVK
ncbi:MAG TPA: hypothetical protein VFO76_11665, partial [Candidatus Kapabacteria bacterium]|nr:hypothetical protein [Candidatus Kapabacteria bacterium]